MEGKKNMKKNKKNMIKLSSRELGDPVTFDQSNHNPF